MSIGYEIQVTPLQMAMAYAAFANEGRLMRPYVVDEVIDERGNVIQKTKPYVVRTPIKPSTIETLYPIFESVLTEQGTAEFARVEGEVGLADVHVPIEEEITAGARWHPVVQAPIATRGGKQQGDQQ